MQVIQNPTRKAQADLLFTFCSCIGTGISAPTIAMLQSHLKRCSERLRVFKHVHLNLNSVYHISVEHN